MKKFMNWMTDVFAPKVNVVTRNPWIAAIQDAILNTIPLILVGSLVVMISILNQYIPGMPDFSIISSFSFGLMSLFIAFLVPYFMLEKFKKKDRRVISGLTGIALFLMFVNPTFTEAGEIVFSFERFGANGMFVALSIGSIVGMVMYLASKITVFDNSESLPDFIIVWVDTIIPIAILLLFGWLMVFNLGLDTYSLVLKAFEPLALIGQSYWGFIFATLIGVVFYSFGMSAWILYPILFPLWVSGIETNAQNVAQGLQAVYIHTMETSIAWVWIGGMGTTLPLVLFMLLKAKSKHLKVMGKITFIPALFNINEPVVFGAPIAFNPILMVPMWLNGFIIPTITYLS